MRKRSNRTIKMLFAIILGFLSFNGLIASLATENIVVILLDILFATIFVVLYVSMVREDKKQTLYATQNMLPANGVNKTLTTLGNAVSIVFLFFWSIYSISGIVKNHDTYSLLAWVIVIAVWLSPLCIYTAIAITVKRTNELAAKYSTRQSANQQCHPDTPQQPSAQLLQQPNNSPHPLSV